MKGCFIYLITIVTLFSFCGNGGADRVEIKKCFNGYKNSILAGNGSVAVKYIDENTIKYYNEIIELAKKSTSKTLKSRTMLDQIVVLSLRHRASNEELKNFTPKSVIIWSIDNGMIGKESVKNIDIGFIRIKGNKAKGNYKLNDKTTPHYFYFNKENGVWKIDLTSIFNISEKALIEAQKLSGKQKDEFIISLIEAASGDKTDNNIWDTTLQ